MSSDRRIYVFIYGALNPVRLAELLDLPLSDVLNNCKACKLVGYKRAFMGMSRKWDWSSISTIIKDDDAEIKAYAFYATLDQLSKIDQYESDPVMFERKNIELFDKEGNSFEGYAYKIAHHATFEFPSDEYLDSCIQSKMAYYYLHPKTSPSEFDYTQTTIDIWMAGTNQKLGYYYHNNIIYDEEVIDLIGI